MKKAIAVLVMLFGAVGYVRAMDVHEAMTQTYHGLRIDFDRRYPQPPFIGGPKCEPVPIPGALWLLGSALAGIAVVGRRK